MMTISVEDAALSYAARGWRIVPIKPGLKRPVMDAWQEAATTDLSLIHEWYRQWPDHGVGIATGPGSGIFVLDVDTSNGKRGDESLADLEATYAPLPASIEVVTGSGGRHIYFRWPDGIEIRNSASGVLGPGLDIRGEGGQVVAPPTIHPDGPRYEWEASCDPEFTEVADAPAWLVRLLTEDADRNQARRERRPTGGTDPGDRFAASVTWPQLLEADGATFLGSRTEHITGTTYELWARPGIVDHNGGTLYYKGSDVLKVFSSEWGGVDADGIVWALQPEATYTKFGYYAARHHNGDFKAAARTLGELYRARDCEHLVASLIDNTAPTTPAETDGWEWEDEKQENEAAEPSAEPEPWEPPVLYASQMPRPEFPVDVLPAWMADYCRAVADNKQIPVDLCANIALGAWSAVCAHITMRVVKGWEQNLNLYLVTVMDSGTGKSPADRALGQPLRDLENELVEQAMPAHLRAKDEREIITKQVAQVKDSVVKGSMTMTDLDDKRAQLAALEDRPLPRFLIDDATPEAVVELLAAHDERLAIISSEPAVFDMASGAYNPKVNINVYLKAWEGSELRVDRKGSAEKAGTQIKLSKPLLTVAVAAQPESLIKLASNEMLMGRGFVWRFMFSLPENNVGNRDHRRMLEEIDDITERAYTATFSEMAHRITGWKNVILRMSPEAVEMFVEWRQQTEYQLRPGGDLRHLREWSSKLVGSVGRLAGLLHLAHGGSYAEPISADTFAAALVVAEYWKVHACAAVETWRRVETDDTGAKIVDWLVGQATETVTFRDIYKAQHLTASEAKPLVEALVERGCIRPTFDGPLQTGQRGRASQSYMVNPWLLRNEVKQPSKLSPCPIVPCNRGFPSLSLSTPTPPLPPQDRGHGDMGTGSSSPPDPPPTTNPAINALFDQPEEP